MEFNSTGTKINVDDIEIINTQNDTTKSLETINNLQNKNTFDQLTVNGEITGPTITNIIIIWIKMLKHQVMLLLIKLQQIDLKLIKVYCLIAMI